MRRWERLRQGEFRSLYKQPLDALGALAGIVLDELDVVSRVVLTADLNDPLWMEVASELALATTQTQRALGLARRLSGHLEERVRVTGLVLMSMACVQLGDRHSGLAYGERALELALRGEDEWRIGRCYQNLAAATAFTKPEYAKEQLELALDRFSNYPYWQARCYLVSPAVLKLPASATLPWLQGLVPTFEKVGDRSRLGAAWSGIARCYRELNRWEEAEHASVMVQRSGAQRHVPISLYGRSQVATHYNDLHRADELLTQALSGDLLGYGTRRRLSHVVLPMMLRKGDLDGIDQCLRWLSEVVVESVDSLWALFDELKAGGLDAQRLGELAVLLWRRSDEATQQLRLPSLKGLSPCGGFRLLQPLGEGGMATVWEAEDCRRPGQRFAIKFLSKEIVANAAFRQRFEREIQTVARLHHPKILPVIDRGYSTDLLCALTNREVVEGSPFMAMPLAEGGALTAHVGRLSWPAVRKVLAGLLDALAWAHAEGVLHLDIKPDNVLLMNASGELVPLLADFGIARAVSVNRRGAIMGTPSYMAPEQFRGKWRTFGPPTDLYAVGCLAWELITGQRLFEGDLQLVKNNHLFRQPPPLPGPSHPKLQLWLDVLLHKDPKERFQTAAQAKAALLSVPLQLRAPAPVVANTFAWEEEEEQVVEPLTKDQVWPERLPSVPARWSERSWLRHTGLALNTTRELPIEGRTEHRSRLWAALQQLHKGPSFLLLRGERGMGATRLCRWLEREVRLGGYARVVKTDFQEGEAWAHLAQTFLGSTGLEGGALERFCREEGRAQTSLGVSELLRAHEGEVLAFLMALARQGPLVVLLKNIHEAGPELEVVLSLLSSGLPVLVVATLSPPLTGSQLVAVERMKSFQVEIVDLLPLPDEVAGLIADQILPLVARQRQRVLSLCAGNPQAITVGLRSLIKKGALERVSDRYRVSVSLLEAINSQEQALPTGFVPQLRLPATALAVLGGYCERSQLARMFGLCGLSTNTDELLKAGVAWSRGEEIVLTSELISPLLRLAEGLGELRHTYKMAAQSVSESASTEQQIRKAHYWLEAGEPLVAATLLLRCALAVGGTRSLGLLLDWERALLAANVANTDKLWLDGRLVAVKQAMATALVDPVSIKKICLELENGGEEHQAAANLCKGALASQNREDQRSRELYMKVANNTAVSEDLRFLAGIRLVWGYLKSGLTNDAERWLSQIKENTNLEAVERRALYLQLLGAWFYERGQLKRAKACLLKGASLSVGVPELNRVCVYLYQALGDVELERGALSQAEAHYREAWGLSRTLLDELQVIDELNVMMVSAHRGTLLEHADRLPGLTASLRKSCKEHAAFGLVLQMALPVESAAFEWLYDELVQTTSYFQFKQLADLLGAVAELLDATGYPERAKDLRELSGKERAIPQGPPPLL